MLKCDCMSRYIKIIVIIYWSLPCGRHYTTDSTLLQYNTHGPVYTLYHLEYGEKQTGLAGEGLWTLIIMEKGDFPFPVWAGCV